MYEMQLCNLRGMHSFSSGILIECEDLPSCDNETGQSSTIRPFHLYGWVLLGIVPIHYQSIKLG